MIEARLADTLPRLKSVVLRMIALMEIDPRSLTMGELSANVAEYRALDRELHGVIAEIKAAEVTH
jgi:hypothetical protein